MLGSETPTDADPGNPRIHRRQHISEAGAGLRVDAEYRRGIGDVEDFEQPLEPAAADSDGLRKTQIEEPNGRIEEGADRFHGQVHRALREAGGIQRAPVWLA